MDIERIEDVLGRLTPKLEAFARGLDVEERDVFASMLELSAIGAKAGQGSKPSQMLADVVILPRYATRDVRGVGSLELQEMLDKLPTKVNNACGGNQLARP